MISLIKSGLGPFVLLLLLLLLLLLILLLLLLLLLFFAILSFSPVVCGEGVDSGGGLFRGHSSESI